MHPRIPLRRRGQRLPGTALVLTALAAAAGAAQAQTAPASKPAANELQTVEITAERKIENIRSVPVSASVMRAEQLETIMTSGQDIRVLAAKVPSLNIESSNGRTFPRLYIRGYGNTDFSTFASQPVSLVYDEVVQESAVLKGFPIFDMEAVEVLRGPQGSLFGRNTPAGVVKFNSVKPSLGASDAYINLSAGNRGTLNFDGAASLALGKEWALRASVLSQHRDNWVTVTSAQPGNLYNGQKIDGYDDRALRVQFFYKPSAGFEALFNVHGRELDGSSRLFRANVLKTGSNELVGGFDPAKISTNGKNEQQFRSTGGSANLSWNLGSLSLHSITGYETIGKYFTRGDIDGGDTLTANTLPFQVETGGGIADHYQFTQEFRVASKHTGPLNYQAGLYFFKDKVAEDAQVFDSATGNTLDFLRTKTQQLNTSWALFGSVNYDLSPALKLRSGLRYTHDEKTFDMLAGFADPRSKTIKASKVTADASLSYAINNQTNVFARLATGFRGASFGSPRSGQDLTFAVPETTTSFEAGVKSDLLNKRARVAFSVFNYDVKNQQLTAVGGGSNITALTNARKTRGQGFELDAEALVTDALRVTAGLSYNHTAIKDPALRVAVCGSGLCTPLNPVSGGLANIDGNPLPQAPKWIANTTVRYGVPMGNSAELYVLGDASYRSNMSLFLYRSVEYTAKPLTELGLKLGYGWGNGKYDASIFCRNCANTVQNIYGIDFHNLTGALNEPRSIGVQLRVSFE